MNKKQIFILYIFIILIQGCASTQKTLVEHENITAENTEESMMIPDNAQKSPSGYAYVSLVPGNGVKPSDKVAVDIKIRVLDFEGQILDEGTGTLAMSHSTPFFEEMLSLMTLGETIRVWGESESRIWEIQMLAINEMFMAPENVAKVPENAQLLTGFEDIYWQIVKDGTGEKISDGSVVRVLGSRWKSNGEILESNRAGRGMLVFINDEQMSSDPIHHALFKEMNVGSQVRIWIPAKYENTDFDVVEDFWFEERVVEVETPADYMKPENIDEVMVLDEKVYIKMIDKKSEMNLKSGDAAEVAMSCWNQETGQLIDASYLREKHDIMDISPELGIWEKIMSSAGRGDTFITWIDKSKLPESVNMGLTCRVHIY